MLVEWVSAFFSVAVFVSSQNRVYNAFQWWSIIQREYERRKINKFYLFSGFDIHYSCNLIRLQQSAASFIIQSHFSWSIIKYQLNLYGLTTRVLFISNIQMLSELLSSQKWKKNYAHNDSQFAQPVIVSNNNYVSRHWRPVNEVSRADLCSIFFPLVLLIFSQHLNHTASMLAG